MKRRTFLAAVAAASAGAATGVHAAATKIEVYRSAECGCCGVWVEHLRSNGFAPEVNMVQDTSAARAKAGIPAALGSCHTALVEGYAIEGHVPASDIKRLLEERPSAKGLVVPGMPMTSPGMDARRGPAWDVLLLAADGSTKVYSSYPAK